MIRFHSERTPFAVTLLLLAGAGCASGTSEDAPPAWGTWLYCGGSHTVLMEADGVAVSYDVPCYFTDLDLVSSSGDCEASRSVRSGGFVALSTDPGAETALIPLEPWYSIEGRGSNTIGVVLTEGGPWERLAGGTAVLSRLSERELRIDVTPTWLCSDHLVEGPAVDFDHCRPGMPVTVTLTGDALVLPEGCETGRAQYGSDAASSGECVSPDMATGYGDPMVECGDAFVTR